MDLHQRVAFRAWIENNCQAIMPLANRACFFHTSVVRQKERGARYAHLFHGRDRNYGFWLWCLIMLGKFHQSKLR